MGKEASSPSSKFNAKSGFLLNFYQLNYKILNEGFLIDFLQKKLTSTFSKKFIFISFYKLNDRFLFEKLIFYIIDLLVWSKNFALPQKSSSVFLSLYFVLIVVLPTIIISAYA